ncbi:MAG: hypothetical protein U1F36_13445 [Planctomycetota bacterium]
MYYLYEHQLGFHRLALGYPSIDGCNAICLQTKNGLFGVHVYGCNAFNHISKAMENEAAAFASFVRNHTEGANKSNDVHLFSVCFHSRRGWEAGKTWKDEIKKYAEALKYKGPVSSFDLSTVPSWPDGQSAYVEYRRAFDQVSILHKPWGQCVHPKEIKASDIADGINYRNADNKTGQVTDTFRFNKALTSLSTDGSGFVLSPESLRLSFRY